MTVLFLFFGGAARFRDGERATALSSLRRQTLVDKIFPELEERDRAVAAAEGRDKRKKPAPARALPPPPPRGKAARASLALSKNNEVCTK